MRNKSILLLLFMYLPLIVLAFFLPIYTDELAFRVIYGRALHDGTVSGLVPYCQKVFAVAVPWVWWPYRFLDSLVAELLTFPHFYRVLALSINALNLYLIIRLTKNFKNLNSNDLKKTLPFFAVGTLFFHFMILRVETLVLTFLLFSIWLILNQNRHLAFWKRASLVLFFGAAGWSYHPISFYFIPIYILLTLELAHNFKERLVLTAASAAILWPSLQFNLNRLECGETYFNSKFVSKSEGLHLFDLLAGVGENVVQSGKYLLEPLFDSASEYNILNASEAANSNLILTINFFIYFFFVIWFYSVLGLTLWNLYRSVKKRSMSLEIRVLIALLASLILLMTLTHRKPNYYLVLYAGTVFTMLLINLELLGTRIRKFTNYLQTAQWGLAALSVISALFLFWPQIPSWTKSGYVFGTGGSFSPFHFSETAAKYQNAAAKCNLREDQFNELVVDDLATVVFWKKLSHPILRDFVQMNPALWHHERETGINQYLIQHPDSMVLAQCSLFHADSIPRVELDGICCFKLQDLHSFYQKERQKFPQPQ